MKKVTLELTAVQARFVAEALQGDLKRRAGLKATAENYQSCETVRELAGIVAEGLEGTPFAIEGEAVQEAYDSAAEGEPES